MSAFTKLSQGILASTLWLEDHHVVRVWITFLALKDQHGMVEASLPGLAAIARVTLEQCEAAVAKFESPDKYSRSQELDGRRIERVEGGWLVVNHEKYRQTMNADERREYLKVKKRESRERLKDATVNTASTPVNKIVDRSTKSTHQIRSRSDQIQERSRARSRAARSATALVDADFDRFWKLYPKKTGKAAALEAWAAAHPSLPAVLEALAWQTRKAEWTSDAGRFIPNPATWLTQQRWLDEPVRPTDQARPEDDWRVECERQHAGRCGSRYIHGQMRDPGPRPGASE